jgi:photosystem II stability/assembly factor-like uncharacterized protein
MKKNNILNSLTTFLFYLSILFFFIGFNFQDSRIGGWIRQYITAPIGSAPIGGIDFKDSLIGYAVTDDVNDTNFVLKTTNGGYNWNIVLTATHNVGLRIHDFKTLNKDTVFVGAYWNIYKTYNGGQNWSIINIPAYFVWSLFVLNTDTMWYACPTPNGLYRTTNGGISWQQQMYYIPGVNGYPQSIYMYDRNMGFVGTDNGELLKTTNSGVNWVLISTGMNWLTNIYFIDSLKGFIANVQLYKTTNGGLNWLLQSLPTIPEGNYTNKYVKNFSFVNDTIYTVFSTVEYPNNQNRAVIYKTTNCGINWGYQIPDTSFNLITIPFTKFVNGLHGWCYRYNPDGIVTYTGGDTTIYTGINNNITAISKDFILFQNYPNPFNPVTSIKYKVSRHGVSSTFNIKIIVFDITGKEIKTLLDKKQTTGTYEVKFDGSNLSSGIYFYSLLVDGVRINTKKAILIK